MNKMLVIFEILLLISLVVHAIVVMAMHVNGNKNALLELTKLFDFINSLVFMIMFYRFLYTLKRVELQMSPMYDSSQQVI